MNFLETVSVQIRYYTGRAGSSVRRTKPICACVTPAVTGVGGRWWHIFSIKVVTCKQFLNRFMSCVGERLIHQSLGENIYQMVELSCSNQNRIMVETTSGESQ